VPAGGLGGQAARPELDGQALRPRQIAGRPRPVAEKPEAAAAVERGEALDEPVSRCLGAPRSLVEAPPGVGGLGGEQRQRRAGNQIVR
jgi:hypothetical protein